MNVVLVETILSVLSDLFYCGYDNKISRHVISSWEKQVPYVPSYRSRFIEL